MQWANLDWVLKNKNKTLPPKVPQLLVTQRTGAFIFKNEVSP